MTTYYAQAGSNDIDAIEWDTNPTGGGTDLTWSALQAADVLVANGNTAIELSLASFTCARLSTAAEGGTAGGGFTCNLGTGANRTFSCALLGGTTACLVLTGTTYTLVLTGDVTGGSSAAAHGLDPLAAGTGKVTVVGDVTGGGNAATYGISRCVLGGSLTITGNVIAATGPGLQTAYRSTHYISGDVRAANGMPAVIPYSSYYTVHVGGQVKCSADGTFPFGGSSTDGCKILLTGTATGATQSWRNASATEVITKVPGYPAEADVQESVTFDYTAKTGTFVVPAEADVFYGTGGYGAAGAEFTPAMRASDIANCEAGNIKDDVVIDDVTGTYAGAGGGGVFMPTARQIGM